MLYESMWKVAKQSLIQNYWATTARGRIIPDPNGWRFPIHSSFVLKMTSHNEQKKASKEKYAFDWLPNGKAHWLSLPFLSLHLESWHYYNQISNCDLSKHAEIWTCHNAYTEGCWSKGDVQHSMSPSLSQMIFCASCWLHQSNMIK